MFSGVQFALTGDVLSLVFRGVPFPITAGIGFITLSGVAVLNGVVLLSFTRQLRRDATGIDQALLEGCSTPLWPIPMTPLGASRGFVPMVLAIGTGADVQRSLAT